VSNHSVDCIDVGSENCPCYLALTNDCLICSRLQGREGCDCNWKGVCVYNEFIQGNRRVNNPRTDFATEIVYRKNYLDDLIVLGLRVGKGFAIKASRPGSYVFLREKNSESYYATPLCVMEANIEDGIIAVAIKIISAKTKTLAKAEGSLMIRGIYRNGVLGIDSITSKHVKDKKILVVAKGIGLSGYDLYGNGDDSVLNIRFHYAKRSCIVRFAVFLTQKNVGSGTAGLYSESLSYPEAQNNQIVQIIFPIYDLCGKISPWIIDSPVSLNEFIVDAYAFPIAVAAFPALKPAADKTIVS
jgi:hypothetical protein